MSATHHEPNTKPGTGTWYEPTPGTTAHRIRTAARWVVALTFGFACVAFLIWCDAYGSTLTP